MCVFFPGIEFCEKLDAILKYANNSTTQGNYIVQKYIGIEI